MFNWFTGRKALLQRCADLTTRLAEAQQVMAEQRQQIQSLQASVRALKYKPLPTPKRAPQSAPKATVARPMVSEAPRVDHSAPQQSTKRAEDSGSDFLLGAVTGLLVTEIFKNDDSSRDSSSSSSSCSSSDSSGESVSSGGGGDFSGGGASGDY